MSRHSYHVQHRHPQQENRQSWFSEGYGAGGRASASATAAPRNNAVQTTHNNTDLVSRRSCRQYPPPHYVDVVNNNHNHIDGRSQRDHQYCPATATTTTTMSTTAARPALNCLEGGRPMFDSSRFRIPPTSPVPRSQYHTNHTNGRFCDHPRQQNYHQNQHQGGGFPSPPQQASPTPSLYPRVSASPVPRSNGGWSGSSGFQVGAGSVVPSNHQYCHQHHIQMNRHNRAPSSPQQQQQQQQPAPPVLPILNTPATTDRAATSTTTSAAPTIAKRKLIEVAPGTVMLLRGAEETWDAIQRGYYQSAVCYCCSAVVFCVQDAASVICPDCRVISPVDEEGLPQSTLASSSSLSSVGADRDVVVPDVGLGVKYSDVLRWQGADGGSTEVCAAAGGG